MKTDLIFCHNCFLKNTLFLTLNGERNRLIVRDMLGKIVFDNPVNATYQLDMTCFNTGLYFLRVENERGTMNGKVVKK